MDDVDPLVARNCGDVDCISADVANGKPRSKTSGKESYVSADRWPGNFAFFAQLRAGHQEAAELQHCPHR